MIYDDLECRRIAKTLGQRSNLEHSLILSNMIARVNRESVTMRDKFFDLLEESMKVSLAELAKEQNGETNPN